MRRPSQSGTDPSQCCETQGGKGEKEVTQLDLMWSIYKTCSSKWWFYTEWLWLLRTATACLCPLLPQTLVLCLAVNGFHRVFLCAPYPRDKSQVSF